MAKQLAFYFNSQYCTGCGACQIACKDKNDLPVGQRWRRLVEQGGGDWVRRGQALYQDVYAYFISSACMHCQKPVCAEACPVAAISKRADGVVLIDQEQCIGCRYCEWACPYGAPQFREETGKMGKCNFCVDYLEQGQAPACVASCPMRVLDYGELGDLQAKYGTLTQVEPLPDPAITLPAVVITPHVRAKRGRAAAARGESEEV